jgi:hypothetical protein
MGNFSDGQAFLIGACLTAATTMVMARQSGQVGGDLEKQVIERAHRMYEGMVGRFALASRHDDGAASLPTAASVSDHRPRLALVPAEAGSRSTA